MHACIIKYSSRLTQDAAIRLVKAAEKQVEQEEEERHKQMHQVFLLACSWVPLNFMCSFEQAEVAVDVRTGLGRIRLSTLHHACLPESKPTDELATWARNLYKRKVRHPFPFQVRVL